MNKTRYDHTSTSGGDQDQGERKDEGWQSRRGGPQSREPGRRHEPRARERPGQERDSLPPPGTNAQGGLAGIGEASAESLDRLQAAGEHPGGPSGTDQPPRMGGPLGPDPKNPHLPEGVQDSDTRGSGAGGFDRGVDAKRIGQVHQGVREEQSPEGG